MSVSSLQGTITDANGNTSDVKLSGKIRVTGLSSNGGNGGTTINMKEFEKKLENIDSTLTKTKTCVEKLENIDSTLTGTKTFVEKGFSELYGKYQMEGLNTIDKLISSDKFYSAYPIYYFDIQKTHELIHELKSAENINIYLSDNINITSTIELTNCNLCLSGKTLYIQKNGKLQLKGNTTVFGGKIIIDSCYSTGKDAISKGGICLGDYGDIQTDVKLVGILFELRDPTGYQESDKYMGMINIGSKVRNIEINYCRFNSNLRNEHLKNVHVINEKTTEDDITTKLKIDNCMFDLKTLDNNDNTSGFYLFNFNRIQAEVVDCNVSINNVYSLLGTIVNNKPNSKITQVFQRTKFDIKNAGVLFRPSCSTLIFDLCEINVNQSKQHDDKPESQQSCDLFNIGRRINADYGQQIIINNTKISSQTNIPNVFGICFEKTTDNTPLTKPNYKMIVDGKKLFECVDSEKNATLISKIPTTKADRNSLPRLFIEFNQNYYYNEEENNCLLSLSSENELEPPYDDNGNIRKIYIYSDPTGGV